MKISTLCRGVSGRFKANPGHIPVFLLVFFCVLMFLTVIFLPTASAAAEPKYTDLIINVKDISTNQNIASLPVIVKVTEIKSGMEDQSTEYLDQDASFVYKLSPGNWRIELQSLSQKNERINYFGQRIVYIQEGDTLLNRTFYLIPVGSIEGTVRYEDGVLVQDAELEFKCPFEGHIDYPARANKFGYFKVPIAPKGECTVFASYKDNIGSAKINVTKGALTNATITLDQSVVSFNILNNLPLLIFLIVILIVLLSSIILFFVLRKKFKKMSRIIKRKEAKKESSKKGSRKDAENINKSEPGKYKKIIRKIIINQAKKEKIEENAEKKEESHGEKKPAIAVSEAKPVFAEPKTVQNAPNVLEGLSQRAKDIIHTLNSRESKIVTFLLEHNNFSNQASIRNGTGIPKTSLIRFFQSLEAKKVIAIDKIGKMKKVKLTEWFLGRE